MEKGEVPDFCYLVWNHDRANRQITCERLPSNPNNLVPVEHLGDDDRGGVAVISRDNRSAIIIELIVEDGVWSHAVAANARARRGPEGANHRIARACSCIEGVQIHATCAVINAHAILSMFADADGTVVPIPQHP